MPYASHNPDRNFSADHYDSDAPEMYSRDTNLDWLFADPVIRERIALLISQVIRRTTSAGTGWPPA